MRYVSELHIERNRGPGQAIFRARPIGAEMTGHKINALLALHSEGRFLVGRERVKLLEKVAELGSIAKAAKATGFSYKTAWDSVNAVNNLLPTPAFLTRPGGRTGGGAEVTEEGRRLIATFHRLEEKLSRISNLIAEEGLEGTGRGVALGGRRAGYPRATSSRPRSCTSRGGLSMSK